MQVLIIGGGNMGVTYAQSFMRSHITEKNGLMILEKSVEKALTLAERNVGNVYGIPDDCIPTADLIILAVKPQDTEKLFSDVRHLVQEQQVVLSIMAGVKIKSIQEGLGLTKVVRSMPNLPSQIGMGMTAFTASEEVTRIELVMVQNLLNTAGKTIYVDNEDFIDAATAVSGSGPAYVWYFMEAMIDAARQLGFSEAEAELLVGQTFKGAVELYSNTDFSTTEWIKKVSSRGGTTEAATKNFSENNLKTAIKKGIQAAYDRAVELGQID